jgi:predicted O-linked N-acetylglucosamine transferase (SPINDLY family)
MALRPAPVQVFWLGHAGGLAVDACDYLIADRVTVPPGEEGRYRQRIVRLPDIYHVASPHPIAPNVPTRAQCGLPERGFVFCAFNNPEKIDETAVAAWMAILGDVPGSVLWLSDPGNFASRHANLRAAAAGHGIDPARLVFAGWTPDKDTHLARHAHAGLLLDSFTLNASTTALDALWAGCPVLTLRGNDFASRIAETMLRAVGLDEMVCAGMAEYRARAVALARDPGALTAVRAKLAANRATEPLFDVNRFARHLGAAFVRMWERHRAGEAARGFEVTTG